MSQDGLQNSDKRPTRRESQHRRNIVLGLVLAALALLFYGITVSRLSL